MPSPRSTASGSPRSGSSPSTDLGSGRSGHPCLHPQDGRGRDADPVRRRHPGARLYLLQRYRGGRARRARRGPRRRRSAWSTSTWAATARCRPWRWSRPSPRRWDHAVHRVGADAARRRAADRGRPHQVVPDRSATCRARRFPREFGDSFPGTGRPMAGQTERLLARARERFAVQDYYGTVHLLEEIVASGRAFADVHHLLGVALSLLGQRERAVQEFARALELNPRYLEALIHQGLVLSELGREARGRGVVPPGLGQRGAAVGRTAGAGGGPAGQHPRRAGRGLRRGGRAGTGDRAVSARAGAGARLPRPALPDGAAACSRRAGRSTPARRWKRCCASGPDSWTRRSRSAWRTTSRATRSGPARSGGACLTRRPENARVDAYLAMLGRTGG